MFSFLLKLEYKDNFIFFELQVIVLNFDVDILSMG